MTQNELRFVAELALGSEGVDFTPCSDGGD
jgi:hypothetical protein